MAKTKRAFSEEDLPDQFHTPPINQGQTVEYSYGATPEGVWMRVHDRSDRSEDYYFVPWAKAKREDARGDTDYWNRRPLVTDKQWTKVTVKRESNPSDDIEAIARVITQAGEFAHGGEDPASVAQEWADEGFDADDVRAWLDARAFDASAAASMRDAGMTPDDASTPTGTDVGIGRYGDTIGYKVSNNDLYIVGALKLVDERRHSNPTNLVEYMSVYRDGTMWVVVETGMPQDNVYIGVGETLGDAYTNREMTPIQSTGRDSGTGAALRWAEGADWIETAAGLEAVDDAELHAVAQRNPVGTLDPKTQALAHRLAQGLSC